MRGRFEEGQPATLGGIDRASVEADDVVLVRWKSGVLLHVVKEAEPARLLIGCNVGETNGWVPRRDRLVSVERADRISGASARHPLLGRRCPPAYRAGTDRVAELRRKYADARVLPALFGCRGLVDMVTVEGVIDA